MFRLIVCALFCLSIFATPARAGCKADVFANYWSELDSVNAVNQFCQQRANWFKIDAGKYQQKDYCFSSKVSRYDSYGREYFVWPTSFWFYLKSFDYYYADQTFQAIREYMRPFSYQGWPSEIKIHFSPNCY